MLIFCLTFTFQQDDNYIPMNGKSETEIVRRFRAAGNRLLLLDYDGTLVNLTPEPMTAVLTEELAELLKKIIDFPGTDVFIITGRRYIDIEKLLNHIPVKILADHGAVRKEGSGWKNQVKMDDSWKKAVLPLLGSFVTVCPGSYIEEKTYSLAWHYRVSEPDDGHCWSRELIHSLGELKERNSFRVLDSNKVVEVLTKGAGKGFAVRNLLKNRKYDFILSIGDDTTDEDMFEYFAENDAAITIKVGEGNTYAKYSIEDTGSVVSLLKQLIT